jgi:hypothetical protein
MGQYVFVGHRFAFDLLSGIPIFLSEDDPLDEAQFAAWLKQASGLPGERM